MKAAHTKSTGASEKAITEAAATSAAASAAAGNDDRFILITIPQMDFDAVRRPGWRSTVSQGRRKGRRSLDVAAALQVGIEARQPAHDFLARHRGISQLAM